MEIHKKILLILTIIVASIILYRLWIKRINIEKDIEIQNPTPTKEGFTSANLMTTKNSEFPLNQYFIKASWNTAYTGSHSYKYKSNTMDISMVIDVMKSGCRFLDFEIYAIQKTTGKNTITSVSKASIIPVVGFSNQVKNNNQMECNEPTVKLVDILTAISQNAFMVSNSNADPLFVQLRVKSANIELYKSLIDIIGKESEFGKTVNTDYSISNRIKLINSEKLTQLKGKKFLIADLENSDPMFYKILKFGSEGYGENTTIDDTKTDYTALVKRYQDIFSGFTEKSQYAPSISSLSNSKVLSLPARPYDIDTTGNINIIKCKNTESKYATMYQSYPDFSIFNISNPDKISVYDLVINHTIHILPFRFYIDDGNLADYENLFNDNGKCAFIKMETIMNTYSDKLSKSLYGKGSKIMQLELK